MKKSLTILMTLCSVALMSSDISWSYPPDSLSTPGISASDARVAIDAAGNAVAVWVENGVVKSKTKLVNMSWSSAEATVSNSGASSPRIVSDQNGNFTAVWVESTGVKGATKSLNGNWSSASNLSSSGASSPSLAVDSSGDVVAVWARSGNIESSMKPFGSNWQARTSISSTGAASPHVAFGGIGASRRAVVVWHSSANTVFASTRTVSGSWSAATAISTNDNCAYARAAVDANANATAIWYSYDVSGNVYSNVVVQAATRPIATGVWSSAETISDAGVHNPANLSSRLSYDGLGNALAFWETSFDDVTYSIQSSVRPVLGDWTDPIVLVQGNLYSLKSDVGVNSMGDGLAVYMFYNGSALQIQSSELDTTGFIGSEWSVPLTLSTGTENANPCMAVSVSGNQINAAAVWLNSDGVKTYVNATTGSKIVVTPPSNLSVVQSVNHFGVFDEYYNTLSWAASNDANVVGYLIYRNGMFLQQVGADTTMIVDDNRVQNDPVTYGVASVDENNQHSPIVFVSFP